MKRKGDYFISYAILETKWRKFTVKAFGNIEASLEFDPATDFEEVEAQLEDSLGIKPWQSLFIISMNKL